MPGTIFVFCWHQTISIEHNSHKYDPEHRSAFPCTCRVAMLGVQTENTTSPEWLQGQHPHKASHKKVHEMNKWSGGSTEVNKNRTSRLSISFYHKSNKQLHSWRTRALPKKKVFGNGFYLEFTCEGSRPPLSSLTLPKFRLLALLMLTAAFHLQFSPPSRHPSILDVFRQARGRTVFGVFLYNWIFRRLTSLNGFRNTMN